MTNDPHGQMSSYCACDGISLMPMWNASGIWVVATRNSRTTFAVMKNIGLRQTANG